MLRPVLSGEELLVPNLERVITGHQRVSKEPAGLREADLLEGAFLDVVRDGINQGLPIVLEYLRLRLR
ncbi:hypothetical protein BCCH1_81040 (plasmid) [Burkholderia contaminans]|uniref:Uncharacterized protein n=1 Tax=Burkholderia contaminans TaxID=488447 RepID=A0A286T6R5_9BURK|nr:hypothetical protein BCCH1_81040 [Burkholderia contaminans]